MTSLNKISEKLIRLEIKKENKISEIKAFKEQKENSYKSINVIKESQALVQTAEREAQKHLQFTISEMVSILLNSITDDPYEFKAEFVDRRNSVECDLYYEKNKRQLSILNSCGHGCADLVSLGLKISYRELKRNLRPVLILDEPFRQLQKSSHSFVAKALKKISEEAHLQFIITTHEKDLISYADRAFKVTQKNEVSHVRQM